MLNVSGIKLPITQLQITIATVGDDVDGVEVVVLGENTGHLRRTVAVSVEDVDIRSGLIDTVYKGLFVLYCGVDDDDGCRLIGSLCL